MSEKEKVKPASRTDVMLKKPHTYAGKYYDEAAIKKGVKINVTEAQKEWLLEQNVI